jgi:hypothetical protein
MRRWIHLAACILLLAPSCSNDAPARTTSNLWVIQGGWLGWVIYREPAIARRLFMTDPSIVLGTIGPQAPHREVTSFAFSSYHRFSRSFTKSPHWLKGFTSVLYDPEAWDATPLRERKDPMTAIRSFASLAHEHHLRVVATPHPNLTTVPNARCVAGPDESATDAFLRCDMMGRAAAYADVVETQAQQFERDPTAYRAFVEACAAQVRETNPDVEVIAGLSARAGVTPEQLYAAWDVTRDVVDGYYLSIQDNHHVPVALAFLRMVDAEQQRPTPS